MNEYYELPILMALSLVRMQLDLHRKILKAKGNLEQIISFALGRN